MPGAIELGAAPPIEPGAGAVDMAGTAPTGATKEAIGIGATAFRTAAGAQGGTIPTQIGAVLPHHGLGLSLVGVMRVQPLL
jgi:hypothetical protein